MYHCVEMLDDVDLLSANISQEQVMVANDDEYAVVAWFTVGAAHGAPEPRAGGAGANYRSARSADLDLHNYQLAV